MLLAVEHQRQPDLVGEHARAVAIHHRGQCAQFVGGEHAAGRVLRIAQQYQAGAAPQRRVDGVEVHPPSAVLQQVWHLDHRMAVQFDQPQRAVTPGQSVVFYRDEECLGGAVIAATDAAYGGLA